MEKEPIHHLIFPNQHLLASTFLRVQEHHESPEFKGKDFTWEQFMDWYAAERGGFSYLTDWNAFNVPSSAFEPFLDGRFDPLTEKEAALVDYAGGLEPPYYIIATVEGADDVLVSHELVHALYALHGDYREAVNRCVRYRWMPRLRDDLLAKGYGRDVLPDEYNAWLVAGLGPDLHHFSLLLWQRELRQIFAERFGCLGGEGIAGHFAPAIQRRRFVAEGGRLVVVNR